MPSFITAAPSLAGRSATAAPSAEVAELQRRLLATGNTDVASLMTADTAQLDPLDARGLARWLKAKGRDLDTAQEQVLVHAHWRKSYIPAGHITEVKSFSDLDSCAAHMSVVKASAKSKLVEDPELQSCVCMTGVAVSCPHCAYSAYRNLCNVVHVAGSSGCMLRCFLSLQDSIRNELASDKVFLQGCDIHGRPVFIVFGKQQDQGRPEETKRFICYTLDNVIATADPVKNELGQFLCLFDLSGEHCTRQA